MLTRLSKQTIVTFKAPVVIGLNDFLSLGISSTYLEILRLQAYDHGVVNRDCVNGNSYTVEHI